MVKVKLSLERMVGFFCVKHAEDVELGVPYSLREYNLPPIVFYRISATLFNPHTFMPTRMMRFRIGNKKIDSIVDYEQLQNYEAILGKVKLEVPEKLIPCRSLLLELR
jgi:hypothetical protein